MSSLSGTLNAGNDTAQGMHRDAVLRGLRDVFAERPREIGAASKRLASGIEETIRDWHRSKRRSVQETLALLPIAREMVLRPAKMNAPSKVDFKRKAGQGAMLMAHPVPVWADRVYRVLGKFDPGDKAAFFNLVEHLRNAQRGQMGDYRISEKVNLKRVSALEAYVFAISKLWSQGRLPMGEVRRSLDPKRAKNTAATPDLAFALRTHRLAEQGHDDILGRRASWDVALLCALNLDPDFEPPRALRRLASLLEADRCRERFAAPGSAGSFSRAAFDDKLWRWAERALMNLSVGRASTPRRAVRREHLTLPNSDARRAEGGIPVEATAVALPSPETQAGPSDRKSEVAVITPPSPAGGEVAHIPTRPPADRPGDFEKFDRFEVCAASRTIMWGGHRCMLVGDREWGCLSLLVEKYGEAVSVDVVLARLWGTNKPTRNAVASLVDRIRNKLRAAGFAPRVLWSQQRGWYTIVLPEHAQLIRT